MLFGVVDKVPDDQKVAGEVHLDDDLDLGGKLHAVAVGVEHLAQHAELLEAALQPLFRDLFEERRDVVALGHSVARQHRLAQRQLDIALAGDLDRVLQRLGDVHKVRVKLGGRL